MFDDKEQHYVRCSKETSLKAAQLFAAFYDETASLDTPWVYHLTYLLDAVIRDDLVSHFSKTPEDHATTFFAMLVSIAKKYDMDWIWDHVAIWDNVRDAFPGVPDRAWVKEDGVSDA